MDIKRIIIVILVIAGLGGGYYYFQVYNTAPAIEGSSDNQVVVDLDTRLNAIRPLATVELDTSIFGNVFFRALQVAIATTGQAVVAGRVNPFTPY